MNRQAMQIFHVQLGGDGDPRAVQPEYSVNAVSCITPRQFHRICRTCLSEGEHKSIFEVAAYDQKAPSEILKMYAAVQIRPEDRLPQNVCSGCVADLFRMHSFVQKCQRTDAMLRYIIEAANSSKNEIKAEKKEADLKAEEHVRSKTKDVNVKAKEDADAVTSDNREGSDDSLDRDDDDDVDYSVKKKSKRKISYKSSRKCRRNMQIRRSAKIQGPPFKCRDCGSSYDAYEMLRSHRKEAKHPEARNHACSVCSKTFTSSKLRQHMRAHTKEKPYQCKVCFQGFSMSGNLKRHMMTHTGERPHVCEICGKGFIQATTLQNHKKTHAKYERIGGDANSPNFVCNYCGRGFKRLARYNAHLKKHFSESGGGGGVGRDIKTSDVQDDRPLREHVCVICKRAYKTKHLLKAHQLTHGEKTFLCSDCGKGFVTKAALQSHLKVHTGEKPHTCNVCKKSFAHVGSFEAHMLIHTGQKPYNCNICAKAFTQLSHLKYHLRTHSGERPYVCSFCGKSFALKGNLTVHIRTHTGETPYVCPVCNKGFYDSSSMKKHRRGHGETGMSVSSSLQPISVADNVVGGGGVVVDIMNSINSCVGINPLLP